MLGSRDGVFMFSTAANLSLVADAQSLYLDGTFQICPHLFYQVRVKLCESCEVVSLVKYITTVMSLFTSLSGIHNPRLQTWPLVYFLLPGKSRENYNTSLILLKEAAQNIGIVVQPE